MLECAPPTHASDPRRRGRRRLPVVAVLTALAMVAAACGDDASGDTTTTAPASRQVVSVVATTTILGDVLEAIVGGHGTVEVLMPVGADPHDFVASSRQVTLMQEADLVVATGLGLEEGLIDVLEAIDEAGATVLWLAEMLDPIPFAYLDDHDHDDGELDPHVWMDPTRMARAALLIAEALAAIDPGVDWATPATAYADELHGVDAEIMDLVAPLPAERRLLVTSHHSLGYFADRYGFIVVGTVIPGGTTLGAPSSAEIARLVDLIEDLGIPVIFAENVDATALAAALAAEVGHPVAVVVLATDSLGKPRSEAGTLLGMLLSNARAIVSALTVE